MPIFSPVHKSGFLNNVCLSVSLVMQMVPCSPPCGTCPVAVRASLTIHRMPTAHQLQFLSICRGADTHPSCMCTLMMLDRQAWVGKLMPASRHSLRASYT